MRSIHEQKMAIFRILNDEHSAFMSNWVGVVKHLPVGFFCVFFHHHLRGALNCKTPSEVEQFEAGSSAQTILAFRGEVC